MRITNEVMWPEDRRVWASELGKAGVWFIGVLIVLVLMLLLAPEGKADSVPLGQVSGYLTRNSSLPLTGGVGVEQVLKAIGYDNSGRDQQRACASTYQDTDADKYNYWYPLQDWGWDRERCKEEIAKAGLPVPQKSSCFFCPAMKTDEVDALSKDQLVRIVLLEERAKPRLQNVDGLWRKSTKKRPGSMTQYIQEKGLLSQAAIDKIKEVPKDLIGYQEAFAQGLTKEVFSEFIAKAVAEVQS